MLIALIGFVIAHAGTIEPAQACTKDATDPRAFGQGTDDDPWLLCTASQLSTLKSYGGNHPALSESYLLVDDVDMTGKVWGKGIGRCGSLHPPQYGFKGRLDGGGHSVSGLTIDSPTTSLWTTGFIACLNGGELTDLAFHDLVVDAAGLYTGAAVGYAVDATLSDVRVFDAVVSGNLTAGGVSGVVRNSDVLRSAFEGHVEADNNAGGLVGMIEWSRVSDSYSWGSVDSEVNLGGVAGIGDAFAGELEIVRTHATVTVTGAQTAVRAGSVIGSAIGHLSFGPSDGDLAAVLVLDVAGLDLFGETEGANLTWSGVVESLPREGMLEASTWERAGWDLDTVWYPPTQDAPPTLR